MATFQEQLFEKLASFFPEEEKKNQMSEAVAPILEAMGKTFEKYDADIKELRKAAKDARKSPDGTGVDQKAFEKLEFDFETLQEKHEASQKENEKLKTQIADFTKKTAKAESIQKELSEKLSNESALLDKTLLTNTLQKEIGKLELASGTMDAVFAILSPKVRVTKDENGVRKVVAVSKNESGVEIEKTVEELVHQEWVNTPEAKRLIVAPRTTGSGGVGSGRAGAPAKSFKDMSIKEMTELFRANPQLYQQMKTVQ